MRIYGLTEGQTDRQTDRQADRQGDSYIPYINFVCWEFKKPCCLVSHKVHEHLSTDG